MALIENFEPGDIQRPAPQKPAPAKLAVIELGGETYLQIDTYGSSSREFPDKVSQSLRMGRDAALQLRDAIDKAFG